MPSLNPFGFLIENRKYPLAHAQRTSFMDKMRAVWTVMDGQPFRLNADDVGEVLENPWRIIGKVSDPIGLVDYLTLKIVWGPIFNVVLAIGTVLALVLLAVPAILGWKISRWLEDSQFGSTIPGRVLKFGVDLVTGLLIAAVMLTLLAPVLVVGAVYVARMAVAAVLTAACLPFVLLAHGLSKLSGRATKNTVLSKMVNYRGHQHTLEDYLAENKLSLDDICFQKKPGSTNNYSLMIKNREGNLTSTMEVMARLQAGQVQSRRIARRELLATCSSTKEPQEACEIEFTEAYELSLTRLQVPVLEAAVPVLEAAESSNDGSDHELDYVGGEIVSSSSFRRM